MKELSKKSKEVVLKLFFIFCIILLCLTVIFSGFSRFSNANKYKKQIYVYADKFNVEKSLILAVIKVESGFNEKAVSKKGACGLMQITPSTFNYVSYLLGENNLNVFNPQDNLLVGVYYLSYLLNKFENLNTALCAYNAGEGNVIKWLKDEKYSKNGKILKTIPYKETEIYVKKVNFYIKFYKRYND